MKKFERPTGNVLVDLCISDKTHTDGRLTVGDLEGYFCGYLEADGRCCPYIDYNRSELSEVGLVYGCKKKHGRY